MTTLQNKIDFAIVFRVKHANPNGDPLNGNRPRTDYEGLGEVTDVAGRMRAVLRRELRRPRWVSVINRRKSDRAATLRGDVRHEACVIFSNSADSGDSDAKGG